jgi:hypothetical protein
LATGSPNTREHLRPHRPIHLPQPPSGPIETGLAAGGQAPGVLSDTGYHGTKRDSAVMVGVFALEVPAGEPHRAVADTTDAQVTAECDRCPSCRFVLRLENSHWGS